MKDALALGGEEGRDKLRKAARRGKYSLMRGSPNGATRYVMHIIPRRGRRTRGTETSHYPEEKKTKVIAQVEASERVRAQTGSVTADTGVEGPPTKARRDNSRVLWKEEPQRVKAP